MRFSELLAGQNFRAHGAGDPVIRGLCYDSRAVAPGDLFVALRGAVSDGHAHTEEAARLGAVALLLEDARARRRCRTPPSPTRAARSRRSPRVFLVTPARALSLIGVTGTNGKTSTGFLIESILRAAGRRPGLIGTVAVRYAQVSERARNTTPESLDLQRTLRAMLESAVTEVMMEVSSHGLALGRVCGCTFRVAAFGNLSQDHLDFHENMDAYRDAKLLLFEKYLARDGSAVVNMDDAQAGAFIGAARRAGARTWRVSRDAKSDAELRLLESEAQLDGTRARIALPDTELEVRLPLVGDFNLENALLACGVAHALGLPKAAIARGLENCPQVPGRVERILRDGDGDTDGNGAAKSPCVFVDYAHTPDAIHKLLRALRPLCARRLIAVFGCGGDRDRSKRPLMARAAAAHCDLVIATSDNPRRENPEHILDDVVAGFGALAEVAPDALGAAQKSYARIGDRRAAIARAIAIAQAGDVVVLAGKGHEDYQIIGDERRPFDDRSEARRALTAWSPA